MEWLLIGLFGIFAVIGFLDKKRNKVKPTKPIVPEIHRTKTLSGMIASINYGRVYPYYIGMSFAEVKGSVLKLYPIAYSKEFNEALQHYERTGLNSLISLPNTQNPYIDNVIIDFNESNIISSIVIVIKDFTKNATQLKELMCAKFGEHTPTNGRYITWSDMRMVIRIDEIDGCIEVVYIKI